MAPDVANKDESAKCLQLARKALGEEDYAKATRLAEKAMRLYHSQEVSNWVATAEKGS
jgi:hypothetical protein